MCWCSFLFRKTKRFYINMEGPVALSGPISVLAFFLRGDEENYTLSPPVLWLWPPPVVPGSPKKKFSAHDSFLIISTKLTTLTP
jgi:hypothetical protein